VIYLGLDDADKRAIVKRYQADHGIVKTVVISADPFPLAIDGTDQVPYSEVIMYRTFYRLLQEIDGQTLIVLNECLRTQNRYDLSYNCIRNYLNLTTHQLIFQQIPIIDTADDFMILFDFDTRSRWKRQPFDAGLVAQESRARVCPLDIHFEAVPVPTSAKTKARYAAERARLFAEIGSKDPHTLPRNLYLIGGADKRAYIESQALPLFGDADQAYVARNKRLGNHRIVTYGEAGPGQPYTIAELPHRFIDFADFIRQTGQTCFPVLLADLKVDHWYFERYTDWARRIHDTYASL
jgi:hypothetical protein